VITRSVLFSLKCTRKRLAGRLRPDPLGELKRSPRPGPSHIKGLGPQEGRGREGKGGNGKEGKEENEGERGRGRERKGRKGNREGKGGKGREKEGKEGRGRESIRKSSSPNVH